jgi:hypothetical protein
MKTPVDVQLAGEAERFAFRFACDDCVHFASEREQTCAHGWPLRLRRSALDLREESEGAPVSFCKEFELA